MNQHELPRKKMFLCNKGSTFGGQCVNEKSFNNEIPFQNVVLNGEKTYVQIAVTNIMHRKKLSNHISHYI